MSAEALDRARQHALSVLKWHEIAGAVASRCASAAASRAASALLPDLSREAAEVSLLETLEAQALLLQDEGLPVAGVRDVGRAVELAALGGIVEPADLADVARTLQALGRLKSVLGRAAGAAPLLHARSGALQPQPAIVAAIDRAIDERGAVRDDASPRLSELRRRKLGLSQRIERTVDSLRRAPEVAACLTDDFVTIREGRHVLPVRADRRQGVQGILHGRSGSGQSLFIEPAAIVDLNNELAGVGLDVEEEIARILRELSAMVGGEAPALLAGIREHAAIDLAAARARLSQSLQAGHPQIVSDGSLELVDLAHPRLVLLHGPRGRSAVVRNDVLLEPPMRGIVITGPNTGGKTVLLEALGLACLMVRAGLPPACAEGSRVPWLEAVFADIGDEQSLERSLSSFSGHVAQLKDVLGACAETGGSALVLVDEIMAGTDPAEGAPLAQSMLEALSATGAWVVVTTHLGHLKAFAAESGIFENAGMEFDEETLRPTYRLRLGVPGASAALFVAEKLGLPDAVVARARELADTGHLSVEALLADLERAREHALRAQDDARRSATEAEALRAQLQRQLERIESRDQQYMRDERAAFEREMKRLREEAAEITRRLQQQPGHVAAAEAVARLEELKARTREISGASGAAPGGHAPLEPGARVRSLALEKSGVVLDPPDARGRVRVQFGPFTMQVAADDLVADIPGRGGAPKPRPPEPRTAERAPEPRTPSRAGSRGAPRVAPGRLMDALAEAAGVAPVEEPVPFTPQTARNTLDLRGRRVDESLSDLARFLETASSAGERCVVIIHGHGTGALKSAVRAELKREPLVQAFRAGREGEGSDGVTIGRLR